MNSAPVTAIAGMIFFMGVSVTAVADDNCALEIRPQQNELAFASIGAPLTTADNYCLKEVLIIPFEQESGAVTLEQGSYPLKYRSNNSLVFEATSHDGYARIKTCLICDPLKAVIIKDDTSVCVLSDLNIISCAPEGKIVFSFGTVTDTFENVCIPTVYYFGREGDILSFASEDCSGRKGPVISYDLKENRTLRFQDFRFEILKASNQGLYYKRL